MTNELILMAIILLAMMLRSGSGSNNPSGPDGDPNYFK